MQGGRGGGEGRGRRAGVVAAVRAAHVAQNEPAHAHGGRVCKRRGGARSPCKVQQGAAVEGPGDVGGRVDDLGDDAAELDRAARLDVDVRAPGDAHLRVYRNSMKRGNVASAPFFSLVKSEEFFLICICS